MSDFSTGDLQILDNAFDPDGTGEYGLAVVLGEDHIECAILDMKRNKFLGLHRFFRKDPEPGNPESFLQPDYGAFLEIFRDELPWLRNSFRLIRIAYAGKNSTLVPSMLFDPEDKERYARFNFPVTDGDVILCNHLIPADAWQVFTVPGDIVRTVREAFPESRIVHASGLFLESVWVNYRERISQPHLFLHLRRRHFDLMAFDGHKVAYLNTFSHRVPDDVIYYLIFVMEQLELDPETIPVVLSGNAGMDAELTDLLKKYIRHCEYGSRNEAYSYSHLFSQVPSHAFFPLLNFFSCGL